MIKYNKFILILLFAVGWSGSVAQIVMGSFTVSQGTNISTNTSVAIPSGGTVIFNAGSSLTINSTNDVQIVNLIGQTIIIPNIKLEGAGTKTFVGVTAATNSVTINDGPAIISNSANTDQNSLVIGKDASISTSNGAFVQGFLVHQGLGVKDYPLGFEGSLGTAQLNITEGDDDLTLTGMAFLPQNGDFA